MSADKPAAAEPSEIAGRYQILKKLGAGAFGTVYKAKDKVLGRMVAIKTIRLEGLAAAGTPLEELIDRFKREAQVSALLKHPNIVTIYDIGESDGMSYIAMEFIDGVGLDRVITGAGRLPLEQAASIGAQVADGLDFAHKNSVVHRDIKPANIMIEAGDRVKVTDFGIAKVTNSGEHLTMTGSLLGTPSYMSPEQARGSELDGRSDLFSVGCVIYEMLAGQKAFRGESITALIFKIITEDPPPIQGFDPSIPEEMVRIISKALAKTPDARYQTGKELEEDLKQLMRAGSSPTMRVAETPTAKSSPNLATMIVPATVAKAPAPATVKAPPLPPPPPTKPAPAAAPPPMPPLPVGRKPTAPAKSPSRLGMFVALALGVLAFVGVASAAGWYFFLRKPAQLAEASPAPESLTSASTLEAQPSPMTAAPTSTLAAATPPPVTQPAVRTDAGRPTPPPVTQPPPPTLAAPGPGADEHALEEEPSDSGDSGKRVADAYRSGGSAGGSRFHTRPKNPRDLTRMELPAVTTLRFIMNAESTYQKKNGRYGTIKEMVDDKALIWPAQALAGNTFMHRNYHFELTVAADNFRLTATPVNPGSRPFVGDESDYIRAGVD